MANNEPYEVNADDMQEAIRASLKVMCVSVGRELVARACEDFLCEVEEFRETNVAVKVLPQS